MRKRQERKGDLFLLIPISLKSLGSGYTKTSVILFPFVECHLNYREKKALKDSQKKKILIKLKSYLIILLPMDSWSCCFEKKYYLGGNFENGWRMFLSKAVPITFLYDMRQISRLNHKSDMGRISNINLKLTLRIDQASVGLLIVCNSDAESFISCLQHSEVGSKKVETRFTLRWPLFHFCQQLC